MDSPGKIYNLSTDEIPVCPQKYFFNSVVLPGKICTIVPGNGANLLTLRMYPGCKGKSQR